MATYQEILRRIQPVIRPVFDALQTGIRYADELHGPDGFDRSRDGHYWAHCVRRRACDDLQAKGLQADLEGGRLPLSAILLQYNAVWMRVLRPDVRNGYAVVPHPGPSVARQQFWRQEPVLDDLLEVGSDNVLVLWQDENGRLREPLELVRPLGGDHRRENLRLDWQGELRSDMADLRARDLDSLQPSVIYERLGDGEAS